MSRPSQLPPRCPLQKKDVIPKTLELTSVNAGGVDRSSARHHRSLSQSSMYEDQPAWLDDLLSESDSYPKGIHHGRSVSDSFTMLDGFVPNMVMYASHDEEHVEGGSLLGSGCVYGPNSPRRRSNVEFSDNSVFFAISDYANESRVHFVEEIQRSCGTNSFDLKEDFCDVPNYFNVDAKTGKRHPGQRSRARKLQYIAELERTVDMFQTIKPELAARVSTLLQKKAGLCLENNKLEQQMAKLQQKKLKLDGEYQILRKEAERLKLNLVNSTSSLVGTCVGSNDTDTTKISWQTLDWTKLRL